MQAEQLRGALLHRFKDYLDQPCWVNYSGLDVLKYQPGGIYLMGMNPALDSSNSILSEYVPEQSASWSAFTDACWKKDHPDGKCTHLKLNSYQTHVLGLARAIGVPINDVFATNAIFFATRNAKQIESKLWPLCWEVHQRFLAEMMPRTIICIGYNVYSAYEYLEQVAEQRSWKVIPNDSGAKWKAADATFALFEGEKLTTRVIGLPHPASYRGLDRLVDFFNAYTNSQSAGLRT